MNYECKCWSPVKLQQPHKVKSPHTETVYVLTIPWGFRDKVGNTNPRKVLLFVEKRLAPAKSCNGLSIPVRKWRINSLEFGKMIN